MKLQWHLTKAFFISLLFVCGFGLIALLIENQKINRFDRFMIALIQGFESAAMTQWMKLFTFIGSGIVVSVLLVAAAVILYFVYHHRAELMFMLSVNIGSACLNVLLKFIFQRTRPDLHRIIEANGFSFPSGHSMAAFMLYGSLTFLLWRHIPTAFGRICVVAIGMFFVLAIGASRIYLGVHYPSDVVGGYLASGSLLAIAIWFYQWYQERKHTSGK